MDIRQLRYFLAVCKAGSVTEAALSLGITQPALSRQISQLESKFGASLFDRTSSGLRVSAAGRRVRPIAQDLVDRAAHGEKVIRSYVSGTGARFRLVAPEATIRNVLAPFLAATNAPIADAEIQLPTHVYAHLLSSGNDLAVNTLPPPIGLSALHLHDARVSVHLPDGSPLVEKQQIEPNDLADQAIIVMASGSAVRTATDQALATVRDQANVIAEPESSSMAQALVSAGLGISIDLDPQHFQLNSRPLVVSGKEVSVPLFAAWERNHYASAHLKTLAKSLGNWLDINPLRP